MRRFRYGRLRRSAGPKSGVSTRGSLQTQARERAEMRLRTQDHVVELVQRAPELGQAVVVDSSVWLGRQRHHRRASIYDSGNAEIYRASRLVGAGSTVDELPRMNPLPSSTTGPPARSLLFPPTLRLTVAPTPAETASAEASGSHR